MELKTATRSHMVDSMMEVILQEVKRVMSGRHPKKIIIFGAGSRGIVLHEVLKSMGHEVAYFIDANKHGTAVCGIPVHEPIQVMYEDPGDILVIVAADSPESMCAALEGYGLDRAGMEYIFDRQSLDNGSPHSMGVPLMDFLLGYNRSSDLPGFKYLGNKQPCVADQDELVIVVLGGSTTDPEVIDPLEWNDVDKRKESAGSWPRFLHELLNADGIKNCIYNGGMSGYTSAQELRKLVRDGLPLRPDIVITLDGINDACWDIYWHKKKYPKVHSYSAVLERSVNLLLTTSKSHMYSFDNQVVEGVSYGLESKVPAAEEWYANQRTMRGVCNEFNIEYISFLQPCGLHLDGYLRSCDVESRTHWFLWNFFVSWERTLGEHAGANYGKLYNKLDIRKMLLLYHNMIYDHEVDAQRHFNVRHGNKYEDFYRDAGKMAGKSDFIVDIEDALNGAPDVIFDASHLTAKGNRLIAERIYRELTSRGILINASAKIAARSIEI